MEAQELINALKPLVGNIVAGKQPEYFGGRSSTFLVTGIKLLRDHQREHATCDVLIQKDGKEGFVMQSGKVESVKILGRVCLLEGVIDGHKTTVALNVIVSDDVL